MSLSATTPEFHARCDHKGCGKHVYVKASSKDVAVQRLVGRYGWQGDADRIVCKEHREAS